MFKLPKCKYCGNLTKLERMEDSHGGSCDIVCSKCNKHQNIGIIRSFILITFNKKILECNHKWELTNKMPKISKVWKKCEDGTRREIFYGIYKCSICGKEERLEIK